MRKVPCPFNRVWTSYNPFHLTDEVCRRLREYGCEKNQLSIDGLRETHDWFRKPDSFDITPEKLGCINRAGIRSVVMTTVSGTNIDEVPGIIDAVVAAGANVFAFTRYCPTSEEKDVGIEPLRYRKLLSDCDKEFKEYEAAGCQTCFNKKDHLWTLYEYETGAFKIPETVEDGMIYGGCNCHLTILPTGDVYACRRVQNSKVANVFADRLADVWVCHPYIQLCVCDPETMTYVRLGGKDNFTKDPAIVNRCFEESPAWRRGTGESACPPPPQPKCRGQSSPLPPRA